MLEDTDTAQIRAWLKQAFEADGSKKPAGLAAHCRVTPQAVNGWLRTGRVTKTHLAMAEAYFGRGSPFDKRGLDSAQVMVTALGMDPNRFFRLPPAEQRLIRAYADGVLAAWELRSPVHESHDDQ